MSRVTHSEPGLPMASMSILRLTVSLKTTSAYLNANGSLLSYPLSPNIPFFDLSPPPDPNSNLKLINTLDR